MCSHQILGILTLDFQLLSAFFELENKLNGERNKSADTMVSTSPGLALVVKSKPSVP
jgi:hypothetical protein